MRYLLKKLQVIIFCLLIFSACSSDKSVSEPKVSIKKENGKFSLYRNGEPFYIKGAAGDTHLDELSRAGGNAIRIWDTIHVDSILKKANENGIAVIVGLPIPESNAMFYYNDTAKVAKQFRDLKKLVNKHKNDPAVLMWCVGNELTFPFKPSYNNFYKAFNNIVDMIHEDDPDHPVTTTMVNFQRKEVFNMKVRTNVDLISFNIFGRINSLHSDLKNFAWFWDGAYLITEWGVDGPWEGTTQTAWSAYIEPSSTQKAATILFRHKEQMPLNDPRSVGSFIFFWGQKQETTHTWYSLFDDQGNETEAVEIVSSTFTGKEPLYKGPKIKTMHLEGKEAKDNILLRSAATVNAEVFMETNEKVGQSGIQSTVQSIKWEIYPEDWFKRDNINNIRRPKPVEGFILKSTGFKLSFVAPEKEGPYRLFATIYDDDGHIATSNTPFYVLATQ